MVAAVSGGLLVALAAGCFWYKADYDFSAGFPQDTESAKAAADLQRGFAAGALAPTEVYLTTTDGSELTDAQSNLRAGCRRCSGVGQAQPPSAAPTDRWLGFTFCWRRTGVERCDHSRTRELRDASARRRAAGHTAVVGGTTAIFADINTANNRDLSVILPRAASSSD
jgi:RND superfamily putative drug exporter